MSPRLSRKDHRPVILALSSLPAVALLAGWLLYIVTLQRPMDAPIAGGDATRLLKVRSGDSFRTVVHQMKSQGWVHTEWPLRLAARRRGWDRHVIPGWYQRIPGERPIRFLERVVRGEILKTRVTIPEGWRSARILAVLSDSSGVPLDQIQKVAEDPGWIGAHEVPGPGIEGYLFPETYFIPCGTEASSLLEQLLRPGREYWVDSLQGPAARLGLDRRELWALASMIEAEAAAAEERAKISAVFWNRLRSGMRLESDPTVLYALNRPPGRVLYTDLDVASPYNTYRNVGLPPGPICSPGRASLRAAVHPDLECDALFFVARGNGTHVFSRTLGEHNRARRLVGARSRPAGAGRSSNE